MKIRKLCVLFILSAAGLISLNAQQATNSAGKTDPLENLKVKEEQGQLYIHLDTLLEENYYKLMLQNKQNAGVSGYRIRIYSDNGQGAKENQKRIRARFLSLYPDVSTYYRYEGSYYKIYVGDFRTKQEAMKLLRRINGNFPDAFIVEDNIKIDE